MNLKAEDEHPTVGIILCKKKHDALVEITLPKDANIHAKQYQLYLPSKEQLRQKALGKRKRITADPRPSAPGTPPHAVQPHPFIRKFLSYAYDPQRKSVVVGPDGTAYAVTLDRVTEPTTATILAINPAGSIRYRVPVVAP
jgi:hypothetical protein